MSYLPTVSHLHREQVPGDKDFFEEIYGEGGGVRPGPGKTHKPANHVRVNLFESVYIY